MLIDENAAIAPFGGGKILISGGSGYLASSVISLLRNTQCLVTRLDLPGRDREPFSGRAAVSDAFADIRDPACWEDRLDGVDIVFHLAAQTSTAVANADPAADHAINVAPLLHLLETCRGKGIRPTVCFASTVTVAGIPERLPVDETHPDHPLTMYDLHKQVAEQYLQWYSEQGFVNGVTLRLANVYGPGPASSSPDRGILNRMIGAARRGEDLTVYGSGDYLRDYLYVEDAARAFVAAAARGDQLSGQRFVIGSGKGHTIRDAATTVAARVAARTGHRVNVALCDPPAPLSPIELRNFVADSRRFREATGWTPRVSLEEGIDRTLEALS